MPDAASIVSTLLPSIPKYESAEKQSVAIIALYQTPFSTSFRLIYLYPYRRLHPEQSRACES